MQKKSTLWERFHLKYRVYFLNENTLEETVKFRISGFWLLLYVSLFSIVSFTLFSLIVMYTPLRQFVPGHTDSNKHQELVEKNIKLDSIAHLLDMRQRQMDVMRLAILSEIPFDTIESQVDSIDFVKWKTMSDVQAQQEKEFIEKYESIETYNLVLDEPEMTVSHKANVYFEPCKGELIQAFDVVDKQFGIRMLLTQKQSILSIFEGTIIFTQYDLETGYIVGVQHKNGLVSVYKNLSTVLKNVGNYIRSGETLGLIQVDSEKKTYFDFEIWREGIAVDPQAYIHFSK